jgi:hypothetical protein
MGHQASSRHSEAANVVAMACWCHERGLNHILLGKHLNWKALLNEVLLSHQEPTTLLHGQTTCQEQLATENHQLCDGYGFLSEDGIVGVMWVLLNL